MSAARGTPTKGAGAAGVPALRDPTALAIQRIRQQREDRRRSAEHMKREKVEEAAKIEASGMPVFDADFQRMITMYRASAEAARMHVPPGEHDICVVVHKRPINKREIANRDWDSVCSVLLICIYFELAQHYPSAGYMLESKSCRPRTEAESRWHHQVLGEYAIRIRPCT